MLISALVEGNYKKILEPYCEIYDGFDGASFTASKTNGLVKFLDLSVPQYGLPLYDIVISIEVAEHIPRQFEQIYLDNLARFAKTAIILSWAHVGQGGYQHVNNRPIQYVFSQMRRRGFEPDANISATLRSKAKFDWLKNNLNYYRRN